MSTKVSTVLQHKGHKVVTVAPRHTVAEVVDILTENRIGAAPVLSEGRLVGIISERDIIRGISRHKAAVLELTAERLMTREVRSCSPDDPIVEIMQIMTQQRIRHVPVMDDGRLLGIVSIGDAVKQRLDEIQFEVDSLRDYITT